LFKPSTKETTGTENEIWTAEEHINTTEIPTDIDGINIFEPVLQTTELSDFHKLIKLALRPILIELEGLNAAKLRPWTLVEMEPVRAKSACSAAMMNGKFQEKPTLIDLVSRATDTTEFDIRPYPDGTFPTTTLLELQLDEIADVNPIRTEFDNPVEENPDPKIVKLVLPLVGRFEPDVEDTKPGTALEKLNEPNPTPTDALKTMRRTRPNPIATFNIKELSENQLKPSDEDM
jgi:hypothetical protein